MRKICVTGGAGFIGSSLVDRLVELGHEVTVIDDLSSGLESQINSKAAFYQLDISSASDLPKMERVFKFGQFDTVYHLAAQIDLRASLKNPMRDAQINIMGSLQLMTTAQKFGVGHFIFASTGGALYEGEIPWTTSSTVNPQSPYGQAKWTIERYLKFFAPMKASVLRLANVYGPRQKGAECGILAIWLQNLKRQESLKIFGDGTQTRDYVYVDDVVNAFLQMLTYEKGGIWNVGTGVESSLLEIMNLLEKKLEKALPVAYFPEVPGELYRSCLDSSQLTRDTGWKARYSLSQGLDLLLAWEKK